MHQTLLSDFAQMGIARLQNDDAVLFQLLAKEYDRQNSVLAMIASSSVADPSVLACEGMVTGNVTTEGYPGARFHAGCEFVDQIEEIAIERACQAFGAQYANVQPHSGSSANEVILFSLLQPGDTILGLDLDAGGHLTHGSRASVSGRYFRSVGYGLTPESLIDYDQVRDLARQHRPRLIISGASAYPRAIDFRRFREIADEVGAYLLADISHIAGLVVAGEHPSPIDCAHFTTTSTYKQLFGPRGGLILMGKDHVLPGPDGRKTLAEFVQKAVFPAFQGTPHLSSIAAKARALAMVMTPEFRALARRIVTHSQDLARCLVDAGHHVITGGSDNHIVMVNVLQNGVTGVVAERALEECGIIINKNKIPGDKMPAHITSGIRIGTNTLALRGFGAEEIRRCAEMLHRVLCCVDVTGPASYDLDPALAALVRAEVAELCRRFPLPYYPMS
ncbi:MAG: putative glycine/serine hydroxymethyltransferase [Chthonomonadales bacterium]|nr:putative glycine/serine hydroxymethyltransferase [Chthonomonadales bacterium]